MSAQTDVKRFIKKGIHKIIGNGTDQIQKQEQGERIINRKPGVPDIPGNHVELSHDWEITI